MLPAVIDATHDRCELPALIAEERARLRHELTHRGALLFRGFLDAKTSAIGSFERAIKELSGKPLTYSERSSPRTSIKGNIYTSTDYPPDEEIFLHNENSYQSSWPRLLYFYCAQEPETLGATPLADVRQVHDSIDPSVLAEFRARGWMVVRNFHQRFGVSWRQLFNTEERAEVERQCRERDIRFEWRDNDGLRTTAIRQAVHRHPDTDEPVWFNHATFFHSSTLAAEVREGLLGLFGAQDLPTNTYYGDGGEIPDDVAAHLRACYLGAKRRFNWRRGDLLVIDNMLVAHGREPFTGPRKIAVAMAEAYMPGRGRDEAEPAGVAPAHAVASTSSLRGSVR
ncbi:MAG: TauD/TfdA family dioxygenase [Streptosporangiaceae bacterium]|nr:TauD/TfdA family dioxygenase [Streptosporangiaceae bacterium]